MGKQYMTFNTSKGYLKIDFKTTYIDVKTCNEPGRENIVSFKTKNTEKKKRTDLEESERIHALATILTKAEIRERGFHRDISKSTRHCKLARKEARYSIPVGRISYSYEFYWQHWLRDGRFWLR